MSGPRLIHAQYRAPEPLDTRWRLEVAERMARRERRRRAWKWVALALACLVVALVVVGLALPMSALKIIALRGAQTAVLILGVVACYVLAEVADAESKDGRNRGER